MLDIIKVDKLRFGTSSLVEKPIIGAVGSVCKRYYEGTVVIPACSKCRKLTIEVTPTKQLRNGLYSTTHNLQMIPLEQFLEFLKEVRAVAGTNLDIYEMHLTKDIVTDRPVGDYLTAIENHEYANGYNSSNIASNGTSTIYISKSRILNSNKSKLLVKFYDKGAELLRNPLNRVLELNEPLNPEQYPVENISGTDRLLVYKLNLLRSELELKDKFLPYTSIADVIASIEAGTFLETLESAYSRLLDKVMYLTTKATTSSLKELAVMLSANSTRDYKLLFANAGMGRHYRAFTNSKEVATKNNDILLQELKSKLIK